MKIPLDSRIVDYIIKNNTLTIATTHKGKPYCAICFYAWCTKRNLFIFLSHTTTRHVEELMKEPNVAGSIVNKPASIAEIKGLQFTGMVISPEKSILSDLKKTYLKLFPVARLFGANFFAIEPNFLKMTDNTLGFGKKIIWNKEETDSHKFQTV
jgi:uncharacterized protein